jgi:acyl carrier protein
LERDQIRGFVVDELRWEGPKSELSDDLALIENHVIDSMGLLRLVAWLESTYGISVQDQEIVPANFGTIAQIAQLVASKRQAA